MPTALRFLFQIPLGFVLACFAGAATLLWPFLNWSPILWSDPVALVQFVFGFVAQAAQIGSVALLPWFLFMVATEILVLPSILLHLLAGLAGGFAVTRILHREAPLGMDVQAALIIAGTAFALVYWCIAGHGAGRWRRRRPGVRTGSPPNRPQGADHGPSPHKRP